MRISDWSSDGCFSDLTEQAVEPLAGDGGIGEDEAAAVVAVELGDGAVEAVAGEIDLAAAPCERAVDRRWRRGRLFDRRIVGDEAARPGPEPAAMPPGAGGPDLALAFGHEDVGPARPPPSTEERRVGKEGGRACRSRCASLK